MQHVLIVDDIPQNIKILGALLEGKCILLSAANGKKAVQVATEQMPDLIIMDVMMPEMDGYIACKTIKGNPQTAEIPIIFITALGDTANLVEGFKAGGVDYIVKPFSPEEVLARVNTHLELKRMRDELKKTVSDLQNALAQVKLLTGLIPMCAGCKKIKDDHGYWQEVSNYITDHSNAQVSHSLCNECIIKLYPDVARKKGLIA